MVLTWKIECAECLETTTVECEDNSQIPVACPMCGSGSVSPTDDSEVEE
ncbi:hypothetical protein VPHK356_0065 [Vibrio phage K356]|nr:hypothetical protein MYOV002v2_p0059 [Vibrio phage 144E46.1]